MATEPHKPDPKTLWQSQSTEHEPMSLTAIHERARTFQSKIRRRNAFEYIGCAVAIVGISPTVLQHQSWMMRAGGAWIMLAAVFVGWQLHRRASAKSVPDAGAPLRRFHREALVRQRKAIDSVGAWYMAPFVPGMALLLLGRWFQAHTPHRTIAIDHLIIVLAAMIAALVFLVIWLLNKRAADRLQRQIEELEAE